MKEFEESEELLEERYELVMTHLKDQVPAADFDSFGLGDYFRKVTEYITACGEILRLQRSGELAELNEQDLMGLHEITDSKMDPAVYGTSYLNPTYAGEKLGDFGPYLTLVAADVMAMGPWAFRGRMDRITQFAELVSQIYSAVEEETNAEAALKETKDAIYWFYHDYTELFSEESAANTVDAGYDFYKQIILNEDLDHTRYLYLFGDYIGENERKISAFLAKMPESRVRAMADTFTEGYRKGFEVCRRDISIKKSVRIEYHIGFERMIRYAIENFRALGLEPVITGESLISSMGRSNYGRGAVSTHRNPQFYYDHKDDKALYFNKRYAERLVETTRAAFEEYRQEAGVYGGPAVIETFGEEDFEPQNFPANAKLDDEQNKLNVSVSSQRGRIVNEFIPGEEYSFTIISYPLPTIGKDFEAIFQKTVEINNLDYLKYETMQQKLIDLLDQGEYAVIKGCGDNETDLKVMLAPLADPTTQSHFENCVADVNIPVGEVFTSPVLTGTEGILHVSHVYLNGLQFKNLKLTFRDGKVTDYTCSNFEDEAENKKLIFENILFYHETLPIGEFAIGTNTTAYKMGIDFDIAGKLPILIAEKTGPHFAVGDTCYSHCEEVPMFNPDGKEVISRENECSLLRDTDYANAYFDCHTDITIPFEELGEISAVTKTGEHLPLIRDGRFVADGTLELNLPLEELNKAQK